MSGRRNFKSPISELFSPDQRTGLDTRKHHARRIHNLLMGIHVRWSQQSHLSHGTFAARRLPMIAV